MIVAAALRLFDLADCYRVAPSSPSRSWQPLVASVALSANNICAFHILTEAHFC
jgi:hypothetical protein